MRAQASAEGMRDRSFESSEWEEGGGEFPIRSTTLTNSC